MASKLLLTFNLLAVLCCLSYASECPSYFCGCPVYWTPWGNHCYRYFGTRMTWKDAKNNCKSFGEGYVDLVSIHSQDEQNFVYNYWKSLREADENTYPRPGMWMGLNDIEKHGDHKWSDGTELNYRNFDTNQELQEGNVYFLWDVHTSKWNPNGKWHNEYDREPWFFQHMCKMCRIL